MKHFRLAWNTDSTEEETVVMASLGLSARAIQATLGIPPHQAYYRLKQVGVKITDYRNGISPLSKQVLRMYHEPARDSIKPKIVALLKRRVVARAKSS